MAMANPWLLIAGGAGLLGLGYVLGREREQREQFTEKLRQALALAHVEVVSADLGREMNSDAVWSLTIRSARGVAHSLRAKFASTVDPFSDVTLQDLVQRVLAYLGRH